MQWNPDHYLAQLADTGQRRPPAPPGRPVVLRLDADLWEMIEELAAHRGRPLHRIANQVVALGVRALWEQDWQAQRRRARQSRVQGLDT